MSFVFTLPLIVQLVVLLADCGIGVFAVWSEAEQFHPLGAVNPGVITTVLGPVGPVQVKLPLHLPPIWPVIVTQARVPGGVPVTRLSYPMAD